MTIKLVKAREIYDSRGIPTVECDVCTDLGIFRASVPSGSAPGAYEALNLRDNDGKYYKGLGVKKAVKNINNILAPAIAKAELDETNQSGVDKLMIELDGTEYKQKLGANALIAISMAVCKAGAHKKQIPLYRYIAELAGYEEIILPVPAFTLINGGSQAGNKLGIQSFMIMPIGAENLSQAVRMGTEIYQHLKNILKEKFPADELTVGDSGGFAPNISTATEAFELIQKAIERSGHGDKIEIAIDMAASKFYQNGRYDLYYKDPSAKALITVDEMVSMYCDWLGKYPIVSLEDPFHYDDWDSWTKLVLKVCIQIAGDDLTATNVKRFKEAEAKTACNCALLKINQIGTVTEIIKAHQTIKNLKWGGMVSIRAGETEETFIADLAVGLSVGQFCGGAPCRSEFTAKYNQLLRIEQNTGFKALYAGELFRNQETQKDCPKPDITKTGK